MTLFCINVGNLEYSKYSLPLIKKLCEYNDIKLFVLDEDVEANIHKAHPSWLKLLCHSLIDDEFILCWDADLIPARLYKFDKLINFDKINACYDQSYVRDGFTFNGKFKYNCGLIGIPKKYKTFMEDIYHNKSANTRYPSYEQYHVNDALYDNNISIHNLDTSLNMMYDGSEILENNSNYNIHYTWKIKSEQHRLDLVRNHNKLFYNKLNSQQT